MVAIRGKFCKLRGDGQRKKYTFSADEQRSVVQEPAPDYEKAEMDLLRTALKRSYKERFLIMTSLMKGSLMMKRAKITCKRLPK
ncbi:hypothetical protein [Niabella drilacis]|uniref:Uncharacterized protein n=1 Tax=Niabella drilacis (strain DSM 25811 / CCM 8410 / CCUG 62505 / LMG 26954 / E90) TaxID=1285928 RepID=A0A1G6YRC0_NIADE|nr:hypothetical protein [Niabella drilacis]SDD92851.1 hypothetical protein SAMN04487894_11668 [Niabella drilacis]